MLERGVELLTLRLRPADDASFRRDAAGLSRGLAHALLQARDAHGLTIECGRLLKRQGDGGVRGESGAFLPGGGEASGDLVATGHSGLMFFSGAGGKAKAEVDWIDRMGVAALPDASVICGISSFVGKGRESMDDEIVCFAKRP